jgi:hypothetical protein
MWLSTMERLPPAVMNSPSTVATLLFPVVAGRPTGVASAPRPGPDFAGNTAEGLLRSRRDCALDRRGSRKEKLGSDLFSVRKFGVGDGD